MLKPQKFINFVTYIYILIRELFLFYLKICHFTQACQ